MTSDKALGFVLQPARREKERGQGARAHCFRGDSSPRVLEIAPGTHNREGETEGSWEWLSLGALGAETPVLRQSGSQTSDAI